MRQYRDKMAERLRNYTCADASMTSSPSLATYDYVDEAKNTTYKINILLDHSHAKVWTISNFVTPEECDGMYIYIIIIHIIIYNAEMKLKQSKYIYFKINIYLTYFEHIKPYL